MSQPFDPESFEQVTVIDAPVERVWVFLTDPALMVGWMGEPGMGLEVETDWSLGSRIVIRGFHHGPFSNTGTVLDFDLGNYLAYTHLSSVSRLAAVEENHATLEFRLRPAEGATRLEFRASGFATESIFQHLRFYWAGTLEILKQHIEAHRPVLAG